MALSKDCQAWLDKTSQEFMVPIVEFDFWVSYDDKALGESVCAPFDTVDWGDVPNGVDGYPHVELSRGYCARLSAPGYMDSTEWMGPYATEDEALEALYETYGND